MKRLIITSLTIIGILEFCGCSSKKEQIIYPKLISTNDSEQVKVVVNKLTPENYEFALQKAYERIPFVRLMMMQTKQKRADTNQILGIKSV